MISDSENTSFRAICDMMPRGVKEAILDLKNNGKNEVITEIRLRANGLQNIETSCGTYVITETGKAQFETFQPLILSEKEISDIVYHLCSGSIYAYFDELKKGYITRDGIRIGVCGNGIIKDGKPNGFSVYTSLNIRCPRHVKNSAEKLLKYISVNGTKKVGGILVVSPPGCGKTTFLRSLCAALSSGFYDEKMFARKKICVADERGELYMRSVFLKSSADFISYLPKAYCIEIFTRVMSPDYIVCDEIGNEQEAKMICDSSSKGINFVASCHGKSYEDILMKKSYSCMFSNRVFSTVCELDRKNGIFSCKITDMGTRI